MRKEVEKSWFLISAELTTADFAGFSRWAVQNGIPLLNVKTSGSLSYGFSIYPRDLKRLSRSCRKRGEILRIKKNAGFIRALRSLINRPALIIGILLLLVLFLYLPSRILFIRVTGNHGIPSARILEAARSSGVRFMTSRKELRSEQVKNRLLQEIPQLSWAGINTSGCVAEISVQELPQEQADNAFTGPSSVIAHRDGVVTKCIARQGNLVCSPGQAVRKGDILISGQIEDAPMYPGTAAEGEIFAITHRNFSSITPASCIKKGDVQQVSHGYTLLIGKKRMKICGTSGNSHGSCGRMYTEYFIALPGGYRLPVGLGLDTYVQSSQEIHSQDHESVYRDLMAWADLCLQEKMTAGRILRRDEQLHTEEGVFRLTGAYLCHEMIGRNRQEKTGVKQDTWKES